MCFYQLECLNNIYYVSYQQLIDYFVLYLLKKYLETWTISLCTHIQLLLGQFFIDNN